jgi:hypothetical protein
MSTYRPHTPEQMQHVAKIKELHKQAQYVISQKPIAFADELIEHNIYGEFWVYFEAVSKEDTAMDMSEKELVQRLRMPMSMRWVKEKFWQEFAIGFKTGTAINWRRVCHGYISVSQLESWLHNKYFIAWLLCEQYNIQNVFAHQAIQAQVILDDEYLGLDVYDIEIKTNKKTGAVTEKKVYNPAKAMLKMKAIQMIMDRHMGKAVVHQVQEINKNINKNSMSLDVKAEIQASTPKEAVEKAVAEIQKIRSQLSSYKIDSLPPTQMEIPSGSSKETINSTTEIINLSR